DEPFEGFLGRGAFVAGLGLLQKRVGALEDLIEVLSRDLLGRALPPEADQEKQNPERPSRLRHRLNLYPEYRNAPIIVNAWNPEGPPLFRGLPGPPPKETSRGRGAVRI